MIEKQASRERHCRPECHDEHLCYLIAQGLNLTDEDAYQALIRDPLFRCGHCGRTARSDASLCVPDTL